MADEEIVIIEGENDEEKGGVKKNEIHDEESKKSKDKLVVLAIGVFLLILVVVALIFSFLSKEPDIQVADFNTTNVSDKILNVKEDTTKSNLEMMIQKANVLYEQGNKDEALALFEEISSVSEAVSYYNLGVAQMREGNYKLALDSFEKAIKNQENRCVSAINAAVCADNLKNEKLFNYYIDLAYSYLPYESDAPLYSYYYGLIMYYKNQYFEALSSLEHPNSEFYQKEYAHLKSKIYVALGYNVNAISSIEKFISVNDKLALGLLYARIGEYDLALRNIEEYMGDKPAEPLKGYMALNLINLKKLNCEKASQDLTKALAISEENATKVYPIKVVLKDELFDINDAQKRFLNELKVSNQRVFDLIFYLAPFKVFDAKQTLDYIQKGNVNMFIDEISDAQNIYKKSSTIAQVNITISKAIGEILKSNLRGANELFQSVIAKYPNHSILHYNLGLTYAQMGDYSNAYKYFLKSYHLDNKNILSGIFSIMTAQLTHKEYMRVMRTMQEDFGSEVDKNNKDEYLFALLNFSAGNTNGALDWVDNIKQELTKPGELLLAFIVTHMAKRDDSINHATKLKEILNNDVVVNILYLYSKYRDLDIKRFALKAQEFVSNERFDMNQVFFGAEISRFFYVNLLKITGQLYSFREKLDAMLLEGNTNKRGILQTVALTNIYMRDFEKAFSLYNQLIDDLQEKDAKTIFLAAVASVGANRPDNAVALLELSKMIDPGNLEARYTLGLLYQEINNPKGALVQYQKVGELSFIPDFFDFVINKQ